MKFIALLVVLGFVAWRVIARRTAMPCPTWATGLLDNPYIQKVAGADLLLDRLGVKPGMRILDVGAGPGRISIPAAKRVGPDGEVTALDIQPKMLAKLQARADAAGVHNIRTIAAPAGSGALPEQTFDAALLVTVLGEIPHDQQLPALREIRRALKPNGVLCITEVLPDPHYQSRSAVRRLAEAVGFRLEREFGHVWAHTTHFRAMT